MFRTLEKKWINFLHVSVGFRHRDWLNKSEPYHVIVQLKPPLSSMFNAKNKRRFGLISHSFIQNNAVSKAQTTNENSVKRRQKTNSDLCLNWQNSFISVQILSSDYDFISDASPFRQQRHFTASTKQLSIICLEQSKLHYFQYFPLFLSEAVPI